MIPAREHLNPPLIDANPRGDLPILVDGDITIADLAYLARRNGGAEWAAPADPMLYAEHVSWLEFAAAELPSARGACNVSPLGFDGDLDALRARGRWALRLMEDRIAVRSIDGVDWFVGERASIVDVTLFPAFAMSRDWGVGHEEFPGLRRWARRFRALPGFRTMPGVPDYA